CVCGKKIGPDPRNFNQRVSLGRNDLLIRTFPNMNIVIITDRKLEALANYFFMQRSEIKGIIYSNDNDIILKEKISHLFSGRRLNSRRGSMLNAVEFTLLNRFLSGACLQEIIKSDGIDVKKIYVHKIRLERKLGISIHKILVSIL
ncbi:hypothetical protein L8S22_18875, partial [Enterobacter roggenkampii]|nr:hypothetical protein [Enterobacter roggenkampii]